MRRRRGRSTNSSAAEPCAGAEGAAHRLQNRAPADAATAAFCRPYDIDRYQVLFKNLSRSTSLLVQILSAPRRAFLAGEPRRHSALNSSLPAIAGQKHETTNIT